MAVRHSFKRNTKSPSFQNTSRKNRISRHLILSLLILAVLFAQSYFGIDVPTLVSREAISTTVTLHFSSPIFHPEQQQDGKWNERIEHVVLMGQFNYGEIAVSNILAWVETWSAYFSKIVVAGPFPQTTLQALREQGIPFQIGREDQGYVSPYINLANVLNSVTSQRTKHDSLQDIRGVLYIHDDLLLNVSAWRETNAHKSLLDRHVILRTAVRNKYGRFWKDSPYRMGIVAQQQDEERSVSYYPDLSNMTSVVTTANRFVSTMNRQRKWAGWSRCIKSQRDMILSQDVRLQGYAIILGASGETSSTSTWEFPGFSYSDALYVGLDFAEDFYQVAQLHAKYGVFLECAVPTIVHWVLRRKRNLLHEQQESSGGSSSTVPQSIFYNISLCHANGKRRRSNIQQTFQDCMEHRHDPQGMGAYHPWKLGIVGPQKYKGAVEWAQQSRRALAGRGSLSTADSHEMLPLKDYL